MKFGRTQGLRVFVLEISELREGIVKIFVGTILALLRSGVLVESGVGVELRYLPKQSTWTIISVPTKSGTL